MERVQRDEVRWGRWEKVWRRRQEGLEFETKGKEVGAGFFEERKFLHADAVAGIKTEEVEKVETRTAGETVLAQDIELFVEERELHEGSEIGTGGEEFDGFPSEAEEEGYVEVAELAVVEGVGHF